MARRLTVLLNGRLVGEIDMARSGAISFCYAPDWLAWEHTLPVSLSLPLQEQAHQGAPVIAYLENLLPDNPAIRERVAAKTGAGGTDAYNLLEKIGRDCVGALQFVVGDDLPEPKGLEGEPVSDAEVADVLRNLATAPLGIEDDDFRISLAGAQEKTALLRKDGDWIRPVGMTPTTHILKTQLGVLPNGINLSDSVENEFLCMTFCKAMGFDVAEVEIADFEDVRSLVVTRFDRRWTRDGRLIRLPQEDFCQALGYPPSQKYQMDGGPGIAEGMKLLSASDDPNDDRLAFFKAQVVFWLLGATDGHAKNFSIALRPGGGFRMTPLYDVLTAQKAVADGQIRHNRMRLAMCVGDQNHYRINEVVRRHFLETAKTVGLGGDLAENAIDALLVRVPAAMLETERALPVDFPDELQACTWEGVDARTAALTA
ncbi:type II toxin-antitoxin system HipA family toxin [Aestuariivita sp.]|jgi:serine/threonine-protein kinase HipA|uniref:type II toxin-antitoxin system HipA family toxin n=1 Tax=Aestuariivita sp. TaxID=1872407 RepID=UPI00216DDE40|nr:type II toxin-antitoxin system HipA family toxin [Aestuariivita sp.]MCE8005406.1 type II toxin-antitoxin system HipA family toxin [Aestuariivita sp.]